jgi:hypothetical protein
MSGARDAVLAAVRRALGRDHRVDAEAVERAHAEEVAGPSPRQTWTESDVDRFLARFERAAGTWKPVDELAAVPAAVADYLGDSAPVRLCIGAHPDLRALDWPGDWDVSEGIDGAADYPAALTRAWAAVAETGSLVMPGSPQRPTSLNFLPDNEIVLLRRSEIVDSMETAWERLLMEGALPRAVNFITGPSRTADVEQTLQLGAHGPRRLHLLLLGD